LKFRLIRQAVKAEGAERYAEAIDIYESMLEKDENDDVALKLIARCHERVGDITSALKYANKSLSANPNDFSTLILAARCWNEAGNNEKTYEFACKAVENHPDEYPEIPKWVFFIFKILSIFPRFKNLGKRAARDIEGHNNYDDKAYEWAEKFKKWYESNRDHIKDKTLH